MHDWHLMHLGQFAMGAAGLVFTEATHVSAVGRITPRCAGLWNDRQEAALGRVLDFCRTWGVAKLGVQLAHAGRKASCRTPQDGGRPLNAEEGAWPTLGPSTLPYAPDWHLPAGAGSRRDERDPRRVRPGHRALPAARRRRVWSCTPATATC